MPEFDFAGLDKYLAGSPLAVVVAERDARTSTFTGHALELDAGTVESFRAEALKHVRGLAGRELLDHQEQTLLAETQASVSDPDVLAPGLIEELKRAAKQRPGQEGDPLPDRIRMYALVAADGDKAAILLRRQNPVRHLSSGITRLLFGSRLEDAPPVFVYDGRFDLVVWGGKVLIVADTALDALFEDDRLRKDQTKRAATALSRHVRAEDAGKVASLGDDASIGAKLRKMWKAGIFDQVDVAALPRVIGEFDLDLEVENGKLVIPTGRRRVWELLALIEDAFVRGAASNGRYRANSKFAWLQRIVTGIRVRKSKPTELLGSGGWSPVAIEDAADDVLHRKIQYVVRDGEDLRPLVIAPADSGDGVVLSVPVEGGDTLISDLTISKGR
jgi:hypothetical protein